MTAYAPQGGHDVAIRSSFFDELRSFVARLSTHGPKIVCGDFNARMHYQKPGEHHVVGPHVFGNPLVNEDARANRSLLVEFCFAHSTLIMNTYVEQPPENQVTYFDLAAHPLDDIDPRNFAVLDYTRLGILCATHL